MPRRNSLRICSTPGCPEYTDSGRCAEHRREAEQRRGSARQRGYGRQHEQRFRPAVLARDPYCVCPGCTSCTKPADHCTMPSAHADHWPTDRRTLAAQGADPDDPKHGRGLCGPCHSRSTADELPGGFNR